MIEAKILAEKSGLSVNVSRSLEQERNCRAIGCSSGPIGRCVDAVG